MWRSGQNCSGLLQGYLNIKPAFRQQTGREMYSSVPFNPACLLEITAQSMPAVSIAARKTTIKNHLKKSVYVLTIISRQAAEHLCFQACYMNISIMGDISPRQQIYCSSVKPITSGDVSQFPTG